MSPTDNGGRVSTREFYVALLDQNKERAAMESRLGDKIDLIHSDLAADAAKFASLDKSCVVISKRIDDNSDEIKKVRNINTFIALLGSTIAGIIGVNR